jgi:hypothetical protein
LALSEDEKRIVRALGQTMFPRDGVLDVDADDADVVSWVEEYLGRMPPFARGQIRALIKTFDLGYAAWAVRPGARFSMAKPSDRTAYLETWEQATTYTQRQLYEALRCMMVFAYVSAPEVEKAFLPEVVVLARTQAAEEAK